MITELLLAEWNELEDEVVLIDVASGVTVALVAEEEVDEHVDVTRDLDCCEYWKYFKCGSFLFFFGSKCLFFGIFIAFFLELIVL